MTKPNQNDINVYFENILQNSAQKVHCVEVNTRTQLEYGLKCVGVRIAILKNINSLLYRR